MSAQYDASIVEMLLHAIFIEYDHRRLPESRPALGQYAASGLQASEHIADFCGRPARR